MAILNGSFVSVRSSPELVRTRTPRSIRAIPEPSQRGSFSAVSASLQQFSGGLGSVFAAAIIAQNPDGSLSHFDRLGYIVVATSIASLITMYFVQKPIAKRAGKRFV